MKWAKLLLSLGMTIALTTTAQAATFSDVGESHWAYEAIQTAYDNGLVNGIGDGRYEPDASVSTAQWATMVANLLYPDYLSTTAQMEAHQVVADYWWSGAMTTVFHQGAFDGLLVRTEYLQWYSLSQDYAKSVAVDSANTPILRYQMAQVIFNTTAPVDWSWDGQDMGIPDWTDIPTSYREAVTYCYQSGLLAGVDSSGTFQPMGQMTRSAAAVVLCRMMEATADSVLTAPSATAVADMVTITQIDQSEGQTTYVISVENDTIIGKLSNGNDSTEENIRAMLEEIAALFPQDTSWGSAENGGDIYKYGGNSGCASYAQMVRDILYGADCAPIYTLTDLSQVQTGDLIHLKNYATGTEHLLIVSGTGTVNGMEVFYGMEGNVGARVFIDATHYLEAAFYDFPDSIIYRYK